MEEDDRRLWERLGRGRSGSSTSACPDANALGGFLEGRISEGEREALEAHLADCGACLEALTELRDSPTGRLVPVPDRLLRKIQTLVAGEPEPATARVRLVAALSRATLGESLAMAAALLVACLLGFTIGSRASWERARADALQAEAPFRLGIAPAVADWSPQEDAP